MNFRDPPLVPREELPQEFHPHRSFYGKLSSYMNGLDPNPPREPNGNPMERKNDESAQTPLRTAGTEEYHFRKKKA